MASEIEEIKRQLLNETSGAQTQQEYQPKWEGDLEALQKQVRDLMAENERLGVEQRELEKEIARLQDGIKSKEKTGEELSAQVDALKELSDQKAWEKKTAVQNQEAQQSLDLKKKELQGYDEKIGFIDQKISVARLKLKMKGVEDNADELMSLQKERDILEAKLVIEAQREKELMQQIIDIKAKNKDMDPGVKSMRDEIEVLKQQIADLEQKQKSMTDKSGSTLAEQLKNLTQQKQELDTRNEELLSKIHAYQKSEKLGIDNKRIKNLVESISAVDAANTQYNDEVGYLRENIAILRTRIKKMELQSNQFNAMKK